MEKNIKKISGVFWHGQYNLLYPVQKELDGVIDIKLYSSKLLDEGGQKIKDVFADFASSDIILLYISLENAVWAEIENAVKDIDIPVVYLGSEGAYRIKKAEDLPVSAKCNAYLSLSGERNFINMFKYVCAVKTGVPAAYEEPFVIPWEGIFHPEREGVFESTDEYFSFKPKSEKGVIALIVSRSYYLNNNIQPETALIRAFEQRGYSVIPLYAYSLKNDELGAKGMAWAVERYLFDKDGKPIPDALIKMNAFFFDSEAGGDNKKEARSAELLKKLNCPVFKPIVSSSLSIEEWRENEYGTLSDIAWSVAMPEMEGAIEPLFVGGIKKPDAGETREAVESRVEKLAERVSAWVRLKKKPNREKKLVIVLNNNPCAGAEASVGGGAGLDALESAACILKRLRTEGYDVENIPENGKELIKIIMDKKAISEFRWTTVKEIVEKGGALDMISLDEYLPWFNSLSEKARAKITEAWGKPPGEEKDDVPAAMVYEGKILITGVSFKNVIVCVQPKRGCAGARCDGAVCKILHDPLVPPTHQYIASYKYFEQKYKADALIHVGTHGNLEFLPGKAAGLSEECFPDICAGHIPCLYLYNSDNPPEGTIAKRRALAVIIDHMQTVLTRGGLYDALEILDNLAAQYDKVSVMDKTQAHLLEHQIHEAIIGAKLDTQIDITNYHQRSADIIKEVHEVLSAIKNTQIPDGLHIIGRIPEGEEEVEFINSIVRYEGLEKKSLRNACAALIGTDLPALLKERKERNSFYEKNNGAILFDIDDMVKNVLRIFFKGDEVDEQLDILDYKLCDISRIREINAHKDSVLDLRRRLKESREIDALSAGLNGAYIPAGPAGVITRGRADVLPTGRNFFTLDPNTVPTRAAYETGIRLASKVIEKFVNEESRYPENFSMYWMCSDIVWADGEGLSQLLYLAGARPAWHSNGRLSGFEIIPLAELGRPRIDITVKVSGILRDNFANCINLLDDAIQAVSALPEAPEQNYIRKHTLETLKENPNMSFEEASRRIFGAKPGTYISGVSLAVYASSWKDGNDFLDLYTYFNGYSYGKNSYGKEAYKQLQNNLRTVDITYNKVVSDEHDLLGCCCYFGNHGGMTAAAKELSKKEIKTYYGDTREAANVEVRTLADELRRVVRARLLNPKWIDGQKRHGYTGAMNISKRVGRVYGWEATTEEVDDWIFDDITKTFFADEENRRFFMENNPWALEEMARRLIEAYERKLWQPEEGMIEEIRESYLEIEGFMEESMGDDTGDFQGGSIDIKDLNEIENYRNKLQDMRKALNG